MTQLIESLQVPEDALGQPIPVEMHMYFEVTDDELHRDFEMRILWRRDDGAETPGEVHIPQTPAKKRTRTRAMALRLPPTIGSYHLHIEWRSKGADAWIRFVGGWPLEVSLIPDKPVPAAVSR
ncbi:MAG: hypothetical protein KIT84_02925 [Labilithrix sp.]|nr:hypothetical protein [Labilithrix sp.]MCW5809935.1 hypothetical protein [Labilithrix sp.]